MPLRRTLYRLLDAIAIPNISLYLVLGQVAVFGVTLLRGWEIREGILLVPALVLEGQIWRIFTFVLVPPNISPFFLAFAWYLFWLMGSALESHWGTSRYNLFLLIGWALTVATSFFYPYTVNSFANAFLAGSVFLAFAFLAPDFELLLFFVLPVKIKWLALIQWCMYGFTLIIGIAPTRMAVLASIGNVLIFFGRDILDILRRQKHRRAYQAKQAQAEESGPRFRCVVCGKNSDTHPDLDFRYCSKCAGDQCYCPDHIRNHEHVKATADTAE